MRCSSGSHASSVCFFRSNQLLTFAKIGLSGTEVSDRAPA